MNVLLGADTIKVAVKLKGRNGLLFLFGLEVR